MRIVVTGCVGTGKTTIAKALSKKLKLKYFDLNVYIRNNKIYSNYNKEFDTFEVSVIKIKKFLDSYLKKNNNVIVDSHLSHYASAKLVDFCVVCKCDIKTLSKRLAARKYSKIKIRENLDSEIFDVCLVEALENKHKVIVLDTTNEIVNKLVYKVIKNLK